MRSGVIAQFTSNVDGLIDNDNIIVLVSDEVSFENNVGKFVIPELISSMSYTDPVDNTIPNKGSSRIINRDDNLGTERITTSNYYEVAVPKHLFYIEQITIAPNTTRGGEDNCLMSCNPQATIVRNTYKKGQRFLILDNEDPVIIGVIP